MGVSEIWGEKKQEDRCGERKWEIDIRKKKKGRHEWVRERYWDEKKKGIDMGEREEINEKN